jgi:HAE1 family hydrophobic/amphiphilic exporter-1
VPLLDAALNGAKLRLRPILMTSFAFILGCVPLATAQGAGGISRQVMGTVVIAGMAAATGIAIFIIPVCFYLVSKVSGAKPHPKPEASAAPTPAVAGGGH